MQKNKTRLQFVLIYNSNSKLIKVINIRSETINYIRENTGTKLINVQKVL